MCLMLPNKDELLLEQSIFKYLSACYPQPCSNYSNSALGSPSSKALQLRPGLGGLRGLRGLVPPGLCPGMLCRSPQSSPPSLPRRHRPGLPPPNPGTGTLQTPGSSSLSDSGGSVPAMPAVPSTLGTGNSLGGLMRLLGRPTPNKGIGMVLQSVCPLAHVAFDNISDSLGAWAEPTRPSPRAREERGQAGAERVPRPSPAAPAPALTQRPCTLQSKREEYITLLLFAELNSRIKPLIPGSEAQEGRNSDVRCQRGRC